MPDKETFYERDRRLFRDMIRVDSKALHEMANEMSSGKSVSEREQTERYQLNRDDPTFWREMLQSRLKVIGAEKPQALERAKLQLRQYATEMEKLLQRQEKRNGTPPVPAVAQT